MVKNVDLNKSRLKHLLFLWYSSLFYTKLLLLYIICQLSQLANQTFLKRTFHRGCTENLNEITAVFSLSISLDCTVAVQQSAVNYRVFLLLWKWYPDVHYINDMLMLLVKAVAACEAVHSARIPWASQWVIKRFLS